MESMLPAKPGRRSWIGAEISGRAIKRAFEGMIDSGHLVKVGKNRWTAYHLARSINQPTSDGR